MKSKEVLKLLKISRQTLTKYVKENKIRTIKNVNGFYDYNDEDVYKLLNKNYIRKNIIYSRVSSTCQKKDLQTQVETLEKLSLIEKELKLENDLKI